jgi:hypothetical protein
VVKSRLVLVGVSVVALVLSGLGMAGASAAPRARGFEQLAPASYLVLMRQPASTVYAGGVPGLRATRAPNGQQFDPRSDRVQRYEAFLRRQKQDVLATVGSPTTVYSYETAVNGIAATLTGAQVGRLASDPRVLAVVPNRKRALDTVHSPQFLGLTGPQGTWAQAGGVAQAGRGVVVGVLDSGVWPENPSFAGRPLATPGQPIRVAKADGGTFVGLCQAGQRFPSTTCSTKLVGARFFVAGFKDANRKSALAKDEYLSARDGDGHGSHTASTAVGNAGVDVTIEGQGFGQASGMAPAARLAVYKVCWEATDEDATGCYDADSVAAIDRAVKDGVDAINFSVSGSVDTTVDAVEQAFLGAASAGIFVAASAGNSGPAASTVAHPSPWVTTVAASTHHLYEGTVTIGTGAAYAGAMVSATGVPSSPLVFAGDVAAAGAKDTEAALCLPGTLSAAKVDGAIVVCNRGTNARVEKSAVVAAAGGVGMVLANPTENSLDPDFHSVPTVHVDVTAGNAIRTYARTTGATATITPGNSTPDAPPVPSIAGFSSRGPSLANQGDLLKPDVSAPGVGVVAAVSPPHNSGRDWDLYSGTSMSSPHVAGLGALILGVHPQWSPATVKSAMMTTAYDLASGADPMAQGAGHVDPTRFLQPGLAYDAGATEWKRYYKGQGLDLFPPSETDAQPAIAARDLNVPSIQIGQLAGEVSVRRTVTALRAGTWTAQVSGLPGIDASVSPTTLTLAQGQKGTFEVTVDARDDAELAEFSSGFITWTNGGTSARIPVAVRPVSVAAPADVAGTSAGGAGSTEVTVTGGFTGDLAVQTAGLVPGQVSTGTLAPGQEVESTVTVPSGASFARFDLDATTDAADLDLVVYQLAADGTTVLDAFVSATGAADERVDLLAPDPGTYLVVASGFANAPGQSTTPYRLSSFVVSGDQGNLDVTPHPVPVTRGEQSTFTVSWDGLDDTRRYLGWLGYAGALQPTIVTVN